MSALHHFLAQVLFTSNPVKRNNIDGISCFSTRGMDPTLSTDTTNHLRALLVCRYNTGLKGKEIFLLQAVPGSRGFCLCFSCRIVRILLYVTQPSQILPVSS